jgi:ferric-dicitrate binding protein FerR (iron transport regulator)
MLTSGTAFALLLLFGSACFAAGYWAARRSALKRERELSEQLEDTSARYMAASLKQSEADASDDSEAEQWKSAYEATQGAYESMKSAYESMKQAAESYEQASDSNRQAYEDMKAVNENLLDTIKAQKDSAHG